METTKKSKDERKIVENVTDEGDQTMEQFMADIAKTIVPEVSENKYENWRETFEVLFPDGELKKVEMYPAELISDIQERLDLKFGPACLHIGVKKHGATRDPEDPKKMIGMYLTKDWKEILSIVSV